MKARTWRKIHRYLGLIIGVQLLLWTASGLIFSWNSIKSVRGEDMIRATESVDLNDFEIADVEEILSSGAVDEFDGCLFASAALRTMLGQPVYELTFEEDGAPIVVLFDAVSGQRVSPIGQETAKRIALGDFTENVEVRSVELIEATGSHSEYRGKELPAYRVVLEHPSDVAIYVSANRGVVTTRRNNRWRVFDFFWMLHTMDYQGRDNFNHWLLKGVSIFGLVTVLSGFVLWFKTSRMFPRKKNREVEAVEAPAET